MPQIVHRMLENDDRARTVLAIVGIGAGVILLIVAAVATFVLR